MNTSLKDELVEIIEKDQWMIEVLKNIRNLNLKDCWIGAGFVRNKVWDHKHGKSRTNLNDIDIIYFDESKKSKADDLLIEDKLKKANPTLNWSVKNQSRMNARNGHKKYANCIEAISFWPETATSIAVRLNARDKIECIAPYGLEDLFDLLVIPTPKFDLEIYNARIEKKEWSKKWDKLKIERTAKMFFTK